MPLVLGAAAAGGVGYYLYTSGGKPKVAEKQFESKLATQWIATLMTGEERSNRIKLTRCLPTLGDMHKAAAKAKDVMPYRGAGAEEEGTKVGKETGAKLDQAVSHNAMVIPCSLLFPQDSIDLVEPQWQLESIADHMECNC
jgi:hypothetical protein